MTGEGLLVDELPAWTEDDSARLTAALVVLDGHQMGRLRRAERIAAIRLGTAKGITREVMAERLGLSVRTLSTFARRHELPLPPPTEPLTGAAAQCYSAAMAKQQHDTTTTKESK